MLQSYFDKPRRGDIIIAFKQKTNKPRRGDIIIAFKQKNKQTPKG